VVKSKVPSSQYANFGVSGDTAGNTAPLAVLYEARNNYHANTNEVADPIVVKAFKTASGYKITGSDTSFVRFASNTGHVYGIPVLDEAAWETAANEGHRGMALNGQWIENAPDFRAWDSVPAAEKFSSNSAFESEVPLNATQG
jgi:hypothetical protein